MTVPAATETERLCVCLAGLFAGARTLVIGANSPIPAAAALLAHHRQPDMILGIQGSDEHDFFLGGGGEQFDFVAEGRLDAFVIGGAQIDGQANLNLVAAGDYAHPAVRFPGSFGSAFVYFLVPRVIIFREEHNRRVLVPKVDFVSAPGTSPPDVYRPGGPTHLLTGKALFEFDRVRERFRLASIHGADSVDEIAAETGFQFDCDATVPATPSPTEVDLERLRGSVRDRLAHIYPEFVAARFI
ncbi:MAG: CoA-transferase [Bauldia litoralis]